ncbi:hypothetical protein TrST_g12912 [Triparma strigata]|uniref:guanine deaminase n=1 Tax=Triparma strigata TaxID=1606541 RepID=A0A9W7AYH3_9STRA|nr:hypothetical protein TrST_g12912 [Triparma strigata]
MITSLRLLTKEDVTSLADAANFPSIGETLRNGFPYPYTVQHAESFIDIASSSDTDLILAIVDTSSPTTILGIISLNQTKLNDPSVMELGYWLSPPYWNQKIITTSISQILRHEPPPHLRSQKMFRVEALVQLDNLNSAKALLKNDFKRDALLRHHNYSVKEQRRLDCHLFSRNVSRSDSPVSTPKQGQNLAYVRGNFVHVNGPAADIEILMDHLMQIDLTTGTIEKFEPASSAWAQTLTSKPSIPYLYKSINPASDFITPGFIDCHVHAPQYSFAGTATDRPLMGDDGWLASYTFPSERQLSDPRLAAKVYEKVVKRLLREGTTTACYFATIHLEASLILADMTEKYNQRALIGKVCMDQNSPSDYIETTEESLSQTEAFITEVQGRDSFKAGNLYPVVTPRFIPTCSKELLSGLGRLAEKYDARVQSHISESIDEVAFVKALGYEETDAEIFRRHSLLRNSVMAHAVWCSREDLALMKAHNSGIACCPLSNVYFASGILDLNVCQEVGVNVGLGTGISGGYSPSMMNSQRTAVVTSRVANFSKGNPIDYKRAFFLATLGSARTLQLEHLVGNFAVGKRFDAVCWSVEGGGGGVDVFEGDTSEDIVQKILTNGGREDIARVYVNGKECV